MLTILQIQDFAIIDEAALALEPGLTVLTGETGAGKSILVDAVELVLGGRGDSNVIRQGAERAEVAAGFELGARPDAAAWLREQALDADGECHLRRIIQNDGRSRGFINGRPVPMQSLRELGERLVELHGQHEHQSLLHRDAQLQLLDAYAANGAERGAVLSAWETCRRLQKTLDALPGGGAERQNRLDYLQHQVQELERLGFTETEVTGLETEQRRLAHAQGLLQTGTEALEALDGDDARSVRSQLARSQHALETQSGLDPALKPAAELLGNALILVQEAVDDLRHYQDALELDPQRLESVEQRLGAAHDLARKHRVSLEQLPQTLEALQREVADLNNAEARHEELGQELENARDAYRNAASKLHKSRKQAARRLAEDVSALMETLGMRGGRFEIQLDTDTQRFAALGTEVVEFLVGTNPGQTPRPLRKVASGGELSRIALAVQVATVALGGARTLIFDEVDAGIGGAVAEIIGAKLRELGAAGQALCVTHLPQVAAQGHHHLQVSKRVSGGETHTQVTAMTGKLRSAEIARMLGGVKITAKTKAHAEEMLRAAGTGG